MNSETVNANPFFHPIEQAILCDWLGRERPPVARDITLKVENNEVEGGPITLVPGYYGDTSEFTLANAVARLVLEGIQNRLPTSAVCYGGSVVLTRDYAAKTPRKLDLLPRFLFQINWANSGPGISWPVAYYLAWLPVYDVYVITESADSPEALGYCDRALGWFDIDTPIEDGAKRVIAGDWQQRYSEFGQEHWEDFWDEGLITTETVWAWAAEIWGEDDDDDEEEEMSDPEPLTG
jgi:hypothetical protein